MSITNYTELQTAVQNWMDRSDLSGYAADYITLAESALNRNLPLNAMRVDVALTGSVGSRNPTPFPTDFVAPIALFLTTFGVRTKLQPYIVGTVEVRTINGIPLAWGINGSAIDLDCPCDAAHTFLFRYRKSFALSNANPTNWLLTNHPDIYLSATLVEAGAFTENGDFATAWQARLDRAVEEVKQKEARSLSLAPLRVDPMLSARGSFNIKSG